MRRNRCGKGLVVISLVLLMGVMGLSADLGAQEKFPTRPVSLIVPAAPGGGTDIVARIFAEAIEPFLGQKMVILNKPGAGGSLGISEASRSRPDGYTLGITPVSTLTMIPHVLQVPYTLDDFSYVTQITQAPIIFCVRDDFPAKTPKDFFEYAKQNQGKLTVGMDGIGSIMHICGERVFHAMGVKLKAVHFGGTGEIIKAFLGGHVDVCSTSVQPILPHIKSGKVRAVFCSTKDKVDVIPNMATVVDLGVPDAETISWRGIFGPKGIPADRMAILEQAFLKAAETDKVKGNAALSPDTGEKLIHVAGKPFEQKVRAEYDVIANVMKTLDLGLKK
jgi:tripartite-type tricarboxylate transporter receptor subunit TctC